MRQRACITSFWLGLIEILATIRSLLVFILCVFKQLCTTIFYPNDPDPQNAGSMTSEHQKLNISKTGSKIARIESLLLVPGLCQATFKPKSYAMRANHSLFFFSHSCSSSPLLAREDLVSLFLLFLFSFRNLAHANFNANHNAKAFAKRQSNAWSSHSSVMFRFGLSNCC
jgi:hypothetical protein